MVSPTVTDDLTIEAQHVTAGMVVVMPDSDAEGSWLDAPWTVTNIEDTPYGYHISGRYGIWRGGITLAIGREVQLVAW